MSSLPSPWPRRGLPLSTPTAFPAFLITLDSSLIQLCLCLRSKNLCAWQPGCTSICSHLFSYICSSCNTLRESISPNCLVLSYLVMAHVLFFRSRQIIDLEKAAVWQGSAGRWVFCLEDWENVDWFEEPVTCQDNHSGSFCCLYHGWCIRA